jgi:hypothetical protein
MTLLSYGESTGHDERIPGFLSAVAKHPSPLEINGFPVVYFKWERTCPGQDLDFEHLPYSIWINP